MTRREGEEKRVETLGVTREAAGFILCVKAGGE